ncbi:hypothetical protein O0I10_010494 [Lichtheimia ornata]|uniref:Uncharacterized protein n=1 Tax=Lichtheimia ornata TaxID=688661 RepID=A0AAD7XUY3_9FUNG|nr:uncharacterized protein O0I10_010494 [Lichtheimia ornata]KAJ8653813.1 hypothetical protein O0I10_010494 [Lichtheimia ornata]
MSLYPESCFEKDDDDDDGEQQEAFNRISGILSNLLEEANNAIHGVENENNSDADASDKRVQEDYNSCSSTSTNNIRPSSPAQQRGSRHMHPSRLPRPIYTQSRRLSNLSIASSSSSSQAEPLFSPTPSTSSRATSPTMSRPSSPLKPTSTTTAAAAAAAPSPTMVVKKRTSRPLSCPMLMARRSSGEGVVVGMRQQQQQRMRRASAVVLRDPLVESYKRLDSSMALVESLSRDLAASDRKMQQAKQQLLVQPSSALRLSALLILPFLHIPHALISMVFDSLSTKDPNNLTGMIAWGIFFALANVMVDRVIRLPTTTSPKKVDTNTTTNTTTDKLPPSPQQHTPAMYIVKRRSRVVRRPSVYRKQPHSSALARSRTQPVHPSSLPEEQQQQPTLFSTSRMMIKRRYSF